MPVLELVPELDPVLKLVVAFLPELKPVPVVELELGFEDLQRLSPDLKIVVEVPPPRGGAIRFLYGNIHSN